MRPKRLKERKKNRKLKLLNNPNRELKRLKASKIIRRRKIKATMYKFCKKLLPKKRRRLKRQLNKGPPLNLSKN